MRKIAEAIANKYFTTTPRKITSLGGGWFGRVYLAEMPSAPGFVVIKIHLLPMVAEREACQLKILSAHATVKMPEVFFVHTATPDIPYDALLMEYIPGVNAGNRPLIEIREKDRNAIAEQMTENLLSYHRIVNPAGFGELRATAFEPDWKTWYKPRTDAALLKGELLCTNGKISGDILSVMQKAYELFDRIFYLPITEARLIHGDYNTWNILLNEALTHVSGVIDPLNSCFADSEMDLYQLNHANGKSYKLLELYALKCPLSENYPLKASYYELFDHAANYYDANVEVDIPFLTVLAERLEREMRRFGLL
jgi:fructosamine-3-kinase